MDGNNNNIEKPIKKNNYKCSVCGFVYDGEKPQTCLKCDNDKFYKINVDR